MKRLCSALVVLALAPALLAPVRLNDATPSFFPAAVSPAPEAYSLPPAEPLTAPTVIYVSPTVYPEVTGVSPSSLALPVAPQAVTPTVVIQKIYRTPDDNQMPDKRAALCLRSLLLVQDLSMLSYQQKNSAGTFALATMATSLAGQVSAHKWPNMAAFNEAANNLPWFYPNKTELQQGIAAARSLCTRL